MDHVNKTLILSLKQDIQSLNGTIAEIEADENIRSWLFPTKNYKFVEEFIEANKILKDNNPKLFLELIVDRLYVGLRLILSCLEEAENNKCTQRFIQRPQQITLGCCFQHLWDILRKMIGKNVPITMTRKSDNAVEIVRNKVQGKTQTETISLDKCDSCASAMMCMKNLLAIFETETDDKMFYRRQIRPKLFDITQFGCMLRTTRTLESCLTELFEKLFRKEQENKQLLKEFEKIKDECEVKQAKVAQLEQEVKLYKEKLERDSLKTALLLRKQEDLLSENNKNIKQIKAMTGIIDNLRESVAVYESKIQKLTKENGKIFACLESLWELEKNLVKECSLMQKKLSTLEKEQIFIEKGFRNFHAIVDDLNKKLNTISKCHSASEIKIQILSGEVSEDSIALLEKFAQFKEHVRDKFLETFIKETGNSLIKPELRMKGNPVEDITRQIEENEGKIESILCENEKLQSILSRLKRVKK